MFIELDPLFYKGFIPVAYRWHVICGKSFRQRKPLNSTHITMKLTRCNPTGYAPAQVADFDQWLRNPFASFSAFGSLFDPSFSSISPARLATDVYEDVDNYYARFEVPGVKKEDIKVELHDRLVTVSVEKRDKSAEGEQSFSLSRSVSVPDSVEPDRIGAKLEDGLLTVTLPKQEQRKPRAIQVA